MSKRILWSIRLMLFYTIIMGGVMSSCGGDDDDDVIDDTTPNIINGIDVSLIPGDYQSNYSGVPSFELRKDGNCTIRTNNSYGYTSSTEGKWSYNKSSCVLMVGQYAYTVKSLTQDALAAELSLEGYGMVLRTWKRYALTGTSDTGTSTTIGTNNGHEYVDLGLPSRIKWATMNVGATTPEGYGDYFAWGETQPKSFYDWSTYKWCRGDYDTMTKYCTSSSFGTVDGKTTLEPEDDAAHVNWGGNWRMPTKAEQDELRNTNNCTWTWTTQNGVNGYKVTSKKNGNSIFLPAAGYRSGSSLLYAGLNGGFWSSSLFTGRSTYAYYLYFDSSDVDWGSTYRLYGRSVRAVCQ